MQLTIAPRIKICCISSIQKAMLAIDSGSDSFLLTQAVQTSLMNRWSHPWSRMDRIREKARAQVKAMTVITLNLESLTTLTHEQFYQLCMDNKDVAMERSRSGELIIMPPVGGESGISEADSIGPLWLWNTQTKLGKVFSSSTVFKLTSGGDRSPDAAWIRQDRWDSLSADQKKRFPPICPDFVIELRSESDRLKPLQAKMQEYLESGLRLGWLINPQDRTVEIYRMGQAVEVVQLPATLSGEDVLPGFELAVD
jgi:Uma2 family endonuclease